MSSSDREDPYHFGPGRDELLPIGRYASESQLSLQALRFYDPQGLLPPVHFDPHSGYCSYRPAQLETTRPIGMLRQLDMPLRKIAATRSSSTSRHGTASRWLFLCSSSSTSS